MVCTQINNTSKVICSNGLETIQKTFTVDELIAKYSTVLTKTDFIQTMEKNTTTGTIYKSANEDQYDNDGEVYYFAGNPTDNWFQFGTNNSGQPLYWRIVRINGDGSVRLIYNGPSTSQTGDSTMISTSQAFNEQWNVNSYNRGVGYMYGSNSSDYATNHANINNSDIKTTIDDWYTSNLADEEEYIDKNAGFCGDRTLFRGSGIGEEDGYYSAYNRMSNPSYKCINENDLYTTRESSKGNKALTNPIGLISADEVIFVGDYLFGGNYLYNDSNYWTMTPSYYTDFARIYAIRADNGYLNYPGTEAYTAYGVRPVINLKSDIAIMGSGTTSDPFKVS